MLSIILLFGLLLLYPIHAFVVEDNYSLNHTGFRCNYNMHRYLQSNSNTLQTCAEQCFNDRDKCQAFGFLARGSYSQRCHLYHRSCITDGRYETLADSDLYFTKNFSSWIEDFASDRFVRVAELSACKDVYRAGPGVSTGAYGDNTMESCAVECYNLDDCAAFSHKAYSTRSFKCEFYTRNCEADDLVDFPNNIEAISESDLWASTYTTDWPKHLPTDLLNLFQSDTFNILDDVYFFPEAIKCGAHTFDFSSNPSLQLTYSQMYCDGVVDNGLLHTYPQKYDADLFQHDICAKMCHFYNSEPRTNPCRGFNILYNETDNTFQCAAYSCNIYDENILFSSTTNENNTFGFLDTMTTPGCTDVNYESDDDYILIRDYSVHFRQHCTSNTLKRFDDMSALECSKICDQEPKCAGFEIRDDRECKIQRKCNSMTDSPRHSFYYSRVNYTKIPYEADGLNEEVYLQEYRGQTCINSVGKLATFSNILYTPKDCHLQCASNPSCVLFEIHRNWNCILYSACDVEETYPVASAIDQVFRYITPQENLDRISINQTQPISESVENRCSTTPDCIYGFYDVCTPQRLCEEFVCTNHQTCYGTVQEGRLPMCDLKKRRCVDYYTSECMTQTQCLNHAKRQWKDKNSLTEARAEMKLLKSEAKINYLNRLKEELDNLTVPENIYISIISNENVIFDFQNTASITSLQEFSDQIRSLRCGALYTECAVNIINNTVPARRMLQESFQIEIVFDVDDQTLSDLINSGYDFNNTEFITQLSNYLNISESDILITPQNGTLELQAVIVDDLATNETLSDAIIDDINTVQASLDEIIALLSSELGLEQSTVQSIDLCGDRNCTGRGICDPNTGFCNCESGFYGVDCQFDTPYPTSAPTRTPTISGTACVEDIQCSNGGICSHDGICMCRYPYYGFRCDFIKDCICSIV